MTTEEFDTFDFLINDEDEVMLLLYQRDGTPRNAHIELHSDDSSAILYRNENDSVELKDISSEVFDSLQDADKLLVCELNRADTQEDTEIINAYEAEISD